MLTGNISIFPLINMTLLAYVHATFKAECTSQIHFMYPVRDVM